MEIQKYIITIQWGKGMHYIAATCGTEKRASELVAFHSGRCDKKELKSSRGAKATVRAWQLVTEAK
jgi:hypothetical protein